MCCELDERFIAGACGQDDKPDAAQQLCEDGSVVFSVVDHQRLQQLWVRRCVEQEQGVPQSLACRAASQYQSTPGQATRFAVTRAAAAAK